MLTFITNQRGVLKNTLAKAGLIQALQDSKGEAIPIFGSDIRVTKHPPDETICVINFCDATWRIPGYNQVKVAPYEELGIGPIIEIECDLPEPGTTYAVKATMWRDERRNAPVLRLTTFEAVSLLPMGYRANLNDVSIHTQEEVCECV